LIAARPPHQTAGVRTRRWRGVADDHRGLRIAWADVGFRPILLQKYFEHPSAKD